MKLLKRIVILVFCIVLLIPILKFNMEESAISEIDNRVLAANPFTVESSEDFTKDVENYVNDRIGFRNEMILAYTLLNDKLFGEMVHPSYTYGKEGYVFGTGISVNIRYSEFHEAFADMIKEVQDYCEERDVPFLFVFNPAKPAVMTEYIAEGINYNREWVDDFFEALQERGIHYLDNTEILKKARKSGKMVFNQKYDANHWNDLGAYYGTNSMLEKMKEYIPAVHVNTEKDVEFTEVKQDSLLVSKFPINEMVPAAIVRNEVKNITDMYANELEMDESYKTFGYYVNQMRMNEGAPRALIFQGSYMNVYGYKYFQNAFGEYIHVHDYQNILNFPYYYNIFKPDCVIFEVAEYTLSDGYFNFEKMKILDFQSQYKSVLTVSEDLGESLPLDNIDVIKGKTLTKITWNQPEYLEQAWLLMGDQEYDLLKTETGYTVTVLTEEYQKYKREIEIAGLIDGNLKHWK